jgi:hypothetical protein
MAYASITHVVAHHPARPTYTATSVPNVTHVAIMIDEAAAALDFALVKGGWDAPLLSSAPSSVKAYFQMANAYGAISMIEPGAQASHNRSTFYDLYKSALKMVETGQLPGMDRNDAESLPRHALDPAVPSGPLFSYDMNV